MASERPEVVRQTEGLRHSGVVWVGKMQVWEQLHIEKIFHVEKLWNIGESESRLLYAF